MEAKAAMGFFYNIAKYWMFNELVTQRNLWVSLHMTGTSCATEKTATVNSGFTAPLQFNGSGYTSGGYQLVLDEAVKDDANNWGIIRSDEIVIPALGAGSAAIAGCLIYARNTTWDNSWPQWWVSQTATPDGGTFRIKWNGASTDGDMARVRDAA